MAGRLYLLLCGFLLIQCSETTTSTRDSNIEYFPNYKWNQIALADTLVFSIESFKSDVFQNPETYVAFTGLEVFIGSDAEIVELEFYRNRSGLIFDTSKYRIYSYSDSTIRESVLPYDDFRELNFPDFHSKILYWDNNLHFIDSMNQFSSYNLDQENVTPIITNLTDDLELISNAANWFFFKAGNQIKLLDVNNISAGLVDSNLPTNSLTATAVANNGTIFVGTSRSKVFKSTDDGRTWEETWPEPIFANIVTDLEILTSGEIYLSVLGGGIYSSLDEGDTWHSIDQPNLNLVIYDVDYSYQFGLLVATSSGIYQLVEIQ